MSSPWDSTKPPDHGIPPQGWYPDPSTPARQRWWDGTRWTTQVRLATQQPAVQPAPVATAADQPAPGTKGFTADGVRLASFGRRLLASVIDYAIISVIASVVISIVLPGFSDTLVEEYQRWWAALQANPAAQPSQEFLALAAQMTLWLAAATFGYGTVCLGAISRTLGQAIVGIAVVPVDHGRTRITWFQAIGRSLGWTVLASSGNQLVTLVNLFSVSMVLWQSKRQTLPDLLARTQVVRHRGRLGG